VNSKLPIKLILYAVFGIGLVVFGILFSLEFSRRTRAAEVDIPPVQVEGEPPREVKLPPAQPNHFLAYLGLFLGCGIGLGIMAAKDLSTVFAQGAVDYVFNDEGEGQRNPDYEAAEMEVTKGNVLEAVNMLRAYYGRRPREVYVALRIAELYETTLHNPLAAALEYEDVLKKKLPDERWGWAAIHLANLYSGKLDKPEQAVALLKRVIRGYPETGAAKKARERLGLPEDAPAGSAALPAGFRAKESEQDHAEPASERAAPPAPVAETPPAAEAAPEVALPTGFRPLAAGDHEHHGPASDDAEPPERPAAREEAGDSTPAAPKLPPGFRPKED